MRNEDLSAVFEEQFRLRSVVYAFLRLLKLFEVIKADHIKTTTFGLDISIASGALDPWCGTITERDADGKVIRVRKA